MKSLKLKEAIKTAFFLLLSGCLGRNVLEPDLRLELLRMQEMDQFLRTKYQTETVTYNSLSQDSLNIESTVDSINQEMLEEFRRVETYTTERMKEIVARYGWPTYSLVGRKGEDAAWVLVQHSPDIDFQKECLALLQKAVQNNQASRIHLAYLTDRILVAEGKAQVYGTQFRPERGKMVPFPIQDEENVDMRRREIGLESMEDYTKKMNQH